MFLGLAVLSTGLIVADIYGRGHRQPSPAMEIVWAVSALYLGPFALWAYMQWGRPMAVASRRDGLAVPRASVLTYGLPGGTASVVAHLIGFRWSS